MSQKYFPIIGSPIAAVILFVVILFLASGFLKPIEIKKELPGEAVQIIPPQKIERGEKHDPYPTNPPTSGWYIDSNQREGVFTAPILNEEIVAALIRGDVVMAYNCTYKAEKIDQANNAPPPAGVVDSSAADSLSDPKEGASSPQPPKQTKQDMLQVYSQIQQQNSQCGNIIVPLRKIIEEEGSKNLLLVPYTKMDTRIALVAWGRIDKMLWFDEFRIKDFIKTYRGKVPS